MFLSSFLFYYGSQFFQDRASERLARAELPDGAKMRIGAFQQLLEADSE
ncbi:MAG: hypothetical protein OXT69_00900 [Candidatus Poribacteria bacterium]|nr:hypothetical protein [Candidatus Poribacteria bacterium]